MDMGSLYLILLSIGATLGTRDDEIYTDAQAKNVLEEAGIKVKFNKSLEGSPASHIKILTNFKEESKCDIVLSERKNAYEGASHWLNLSIQVNSCIYDYVRRCKSLGKKEQKVYIYNCNSGIFSLEHV